MNVHPSDVMALVDRLVAIENQLANLMKERVDTRARLDSAVAALSTSPSPSTATEPVKKPRQVRPNGRPAAVITMLTDAGVPVSLEAIAQKAEWTREATSKVLSSMLGSGLVDRTADGDYILPEWIRDRPRD